LDGSRKWIGKCDTITGVSTKHHEIFLSVIVKKQDTTEKYKEQKRPKWSLFLCEKRNA